MDITPELLKRIQEDFQSGFKNSQLVSGLYARVRDGTATYQEANEFAVEIGDILSGAYKRNLSSDVLPDGRMYYNIAQRILNPTMKNNYELIKDVTNQVQESLNKAANIGIKPITPELNQDRIDGIINRISVEEKFDDVAWILDEPIKNFSQSIVDDAIRSNVEFHAKAGMQPRIVRKLMGGCCEWCREVAGTYIYPDVPKDVYRRHQRCRCTVDYNPGRGKIQNVHSKKWRNEDETDKLEARKSLGLAEQASKDEILKRVQGRGMDKYDTAVANEPDITAKVSDIAEHTEMEMYGLQHRIKSRQRYAEKLEQNLIQGKKEVNDVIRYTLGTEKPSELVEKMTAAIEEFSDSGYNTVVLKNSWNDKKNPYRGINTTIVAPNNQKFEVQYHTKESYEVKEKMHNLYEKARTIENKRSPEFIQLQEKMYELSDSLEVPKNINEVESYGKQ